ncbi:putative ATPase, AAA-type, core, AAA-type ATPase domain-containing protein [Helianthus annuus]|nr:putative ATPase, AAA-type, core, AAA-type ATPase domain-containing protein [Helianthus annuus]
MMGEMTLMAVAMSAWAMFMQLFPGQLRGDARRYVNKLVSYVYPYVEITFREFQVDTWFERSEAFEAIERYLSANSSKMAKRLKANVVKDCKSVVLSLAENEEVTDEFNGIRIWWTSNKDTPEQRALFSYRGDEENRFYRLTCRREHRDIITKDYVKHVLDEGKAIAVRTRQRKLYTNNKTEKWSRFKRTMWSHIIFEHPSTFDTLAMDPKKKKEILNDLITFSKSKDYYKKVGKSWKRGYLLYGPPGTGKSSMIAAMANLLDYDIYDLELASVKDNTDLRKLLIDTSTKSIIVIEDIDCSLNLTGQRKEKKEEGKEDKDPIEKKVEEELDPALIRRGRMDKHIEMSYCCYETFKVLAKNYLDLDSHELFETICRMLGETQMTPADVAENLMPKSDEETPEICLNNLIKSLEDAKEVARLKALEDAKIKVEEEAGKKKDEDGEKEQKIDAKLGDEEGKKASDAKENGVMLA